MRVLLLGYFGFLDTEAIYMNPMWLRPAIVGGAIMGVGFILGGYCPGTSVCAAAIGKVDAMFFVGGGILGVFAFGELYPFYHTFYESTSLGALKVFDSLGMSQGLFAFLLIAMAVAAFTITTMIEKRANKISAPSLAFKPYNHIAAGTFVFALGILFIFLPDRRTHLINKVSGTNYMNAHPTAMMEADELAFRIIDREPNIRIIDVRSPESFAARALPGSVNIQLRDFFSKEWIVSFSQRHVKKVILGNNETQERTAFLLLQELGYENLAVLRGGFDMFNKSILTPATFIPDGTRGDAVAMQFREKARTEIFKMIEQGKNRGPKEPKKEKKIQGGC